MTARRTAVITGAAHGIGAATAVMLAADTIVHLVDVDADGLHRTCAAIEGRGQRAVPHVFSVADDSRWTQLARDLDRVDVLVNNAYLAQVKPLQQQTPDGWRHQLDVNVVAHFLAVRALEPLLRTSHAAVVNVSSVHGFVGIPGYSAYAASKGAILALSRQLAVELAPDVRVNAVVPGPVLTAAWDGIDLEDRQRSMDATALLRLGAPEEVAAAINFLAGPDASFVTGAHLVVDGGWLAKKDSV